MTVRDERPPVWVGHIFLKTPRVAASREFMLKLGMRAIAHGDDFAVLELRAGTHLLLLQDDEEGSGLAPFDLMVEDLDATHARLAREGLSPSAIEEGSIHRSFRVRDPSGREIVFNSSHVSDRPV